MRLGVGGLVVLWTSTGAAAAGAVVAVAMSSRTDVGASAWLSLIVALSFTVCGLLAWWRRPYNRTGALMVAVGLSWDASLLVYAHDPRLYTIGLAAKYLPFAVFGHVLLAFPSGLLRDRWPRTLVALGYLDAVVLRLVWMLFAGPLNTDCDCPGSVVDAHASSGAAHALEYAQRALGLVVVVGTVAIIVGRWRRASPAYRRVLAPVVLTGGVTGLFLGLDLVIGWFSADGGDVLWLLVLVALGSVPVAFLAGMIRARLAQGAIAQLVVELGGTPASGALRDVLARALRDPGLRLAYWLPEAQTYVDAEGRRVELPADGENGEAATIVEQDGRRIAALVHDEALRDHPELVNAVCAAAGLALENERLQVELKARLDELAGERDFVTAVIDTADTLVCVLDRAGRFVRFNRACERVSGYSSEEVIGRHLSLLLPEEERDGVAVALADVRTHDVARPNENNWVTRSGDRRLIAWRNTALRDASTGADYVVSSGIDITEARRADEELRASRARIVEAGDRERSRLERNLHDGAQQHLVALSLTLRMAQAKLASDPAEAEQILAGANEELAQALSELRELARGIHPAILTDRGLEAAVQALAGRTPLPVEIAASLDGRLPPSVEAAAYYIVAESIANVSKYAQASSVRVELARANAALRVQVVDDGVGGADPLGGTGLRGLVDRVESLDGDLAVTSPPGGGTIVRAEIPLGP
jgi:PAS domain S-box-containing protein